MATGAGGALEQVAERHAGRENARRGKVAHALKFVMIRGNGPARDFALVQRTCNGVSTS